MAYRPNGLGMPNSPPAGELPDEVTVGVSAGGRSAGHSPVTVSGNGMGGGIAPVKEVVDPLFATGFVLQGAGDPIVVIAVDWCEIRNDAYDRWREAIAAAVGTKRERVLVSCVHQHDTPVADLTAQRL